MSHHVKFPKIRGFHNIVKEVKAFPIDGAYPSMSFRAKMKIHGCVDSHTLITMKGGVTRPISSLKKGDEIISYNEKLGFCEIDTVTDVISNELDKNWIKLTFSNGRELKCTEDHPVYTKNRGYVPAKLLLSTDLLVGL